MEFTFSFMVRDRSVERSLRPVYEILPSLLERMEERLHGKADIKGLHVLVVGDLKTIKTEREKNEFFQLYYPLGDISGYDLGTREGCADMIESFISVCLSNLPLDTDCMKIAKIAICEWRSEI